MSDAIDAARELLSSATRVAVLTGAGVSEESGVPTFRGPGGLWRQFRPEQLATPEAFARDPKLVWEWYDWRRQKVAGAEPNAAHRALAEMERRLYSGTDKPWERWHPAGGPSSGVSASSREARPGDVGRVSGGLRDEAKEPAGRMPALPGRRGRLSHFALITQNVDDLHERAGSQCVYHLHGEIWLLRCTGCGAEERNREAPLALIPPRCKCGALLRPGVVWFGEALPEDAWAAAAEAARNAEVFLVVGTSALVQPAASLPLIARQAGARLIAVNRDPTPLSSVAEVVLRGPAGELFPALL